MGEKPDTVEALRDSLARCPHCGQPMKLVRTIPSCGPGLPELLAYYCSTCVHAETKSAHD